MDITSTVVGSTIKSEKKLRINFDQKDDFPYSVLNCDRRHQYIEVDDTYIRTNALRFLLITYEKEYSFSTLESRTIEIDQTLIQYISKAIDVYLPQSCKSHLEQLAALNKGLDYDDIKYRVAEDGSRLLDHTSIFNWFIKWFKYIPSSENVLHNLLIQVIEYNKVLTTEIITKCKVNTPLLINELYNIISCDDYPITVKAVAKFHIYRLRHSLKKDNSPSIEVSRAIKTIITTCACAKRRCYKEILDYLVNHFIETELPNVSNNLLPQSP